MIGLMSTTIESAAKVEIDGFTILLIIVIIDIVDSIVIAHAN